MANTVHDTAIKKLKLLFTVVDRPKAEFYMDVLSQFEVNYQLMTGGLGTATSEFVEMLGLNKQKAVIVSVIREDMADAIMNCLEDKFKTIKNGKGIVLTCNAQIDRQTIDRTDTCTGGSIMPYYLVLREAAKIAGVKTVVEKGDCPWVGFTEHPAADGSVIVMAINFEPRAMECPVKINGKLGRVWRGDVKGDKITLAPNEVALFEVK
jgi:hypothetical protein